MKAFFGRLKKHWITVWLVVIAAGFSTFVSYAIYTEVSTVKRVVITRSAPKELFSSNCMYANPYERRMASTEFNINVNNFDPSSRDVPNPTDIQYTLTAQLMVKYNGTIMTFDELAGRLGEDTTTYNTIVGRATGYKIGKSQDNNTSGIIATPTMQEFTSVHSFQVTFGPTEETPLNYETLPGNEVSTDRFKVQIPASDLEKPYDEIEFFIYVKADAVDTGLTDLQAYLYGSKNVSVSASWSGTLVEQNTASLDYDFYNYVISGSGSGKLDIMWDDEWFEIDDFFFNTGLSGVTFDASCLDGEGHVQPGTVSGGTHDGWKKVTIVVNSSESKSRYELQLYKVKPDTPYTGTEGNAANHIHCEMPQNQN
ncbi:MAG: hypothetical protein IKN66_14250 [Ruminococcus sp.]|nr:hypothetical protein [Ruminococcus sp.]